MVRYGTEDRQHCVNMSCVYSPFFPFVFFLVDAPPFCRSQGAALRYASNPVMLARCPWADSVSCALFRSRPTDHPSHLCLAGDHILLELIFGIFVRLVQLPGSAHRCTQLKISLRAWSSENQGLLVQHSLCSEVTFMQGCYGPRTSGSPYPSCIVTTVEHAHPERIEQHSNWPPTNARVSFSEEQRNAVFAYY
ncbi:hypothetical protein B0T24DRAFT_30229 [Lasiosphaeria ovina]|uniref:Uncharacterized protein n=1 Tax=Lasiosphaeria ovina TaxID=92902 RepID=A0AAE0NKE1_9PEZI|nr:hypothetical protein B0T24DRAFT_30229 [Lasiosphaeria ovina]